MESGEWSEWWRCEMMIRENGTWCFLSDKMETEVSMVFLSALFLFFFHILLFFSFFFFYNKSVHTYPQYNERPCKQMLTKIKVEKKNTIHLKVKLFEWWSTGAYYTLCDSKPVILQTANSRLDVTERRPWKCFHSCFFGRFEFLKQSQYFHATLKRCKRRKKNDEKWRGRTRTKKNKHAIEDEFNGMKYFYWVNECVCRIVNGNDLCNVIFFTVIK